MLSSLCKFCSLPGQARRWIVPVCRALAGFDPLLGQTIGDFSKTLKRDQREDCPYGVEEIFQHGEGLTLRRIAKTDARSGPASTVAVGPFAVNRSASILPPQHSIVAAKVIPPCAIRPRMFSTWRAPNSVSLPIFFPNHRLGASRASAACAKSADYYGWCYISDTSTSGSLFSPAEPRRDT
jgi:hypothetical protein